MFKILITSRHSYNGCSINTIVVAFDTRDQADIAIQRINEGRKAVDYQQATPLY